MSTNSVAKARGPRSALLLVKAKVMNPESTLSAPERLTALAVADHMREVEPGRFESFVSVARLAKLTGLSGRSVRRALDTLCNPLAPLFTRRRRKSARGLGCFIFGLVVDVAALLETRAQGVATVADADETEGVATLATQNLSDADDAGEAEAPGVEGVASVAAPNLAPEPEPRPELVEGEATVACPDRPQWPRGTSYIEPVTDTGALTATDQHQGSLNEREPAPLLEAFPDLCSVCGGEALAEFVGRLLCWRHAPREPEPLQQPDEQRVAAPEEDTTLRRKPLPGDEAGPEPEPEMQPEADAGPPAHAAPQSSAERRAAQAAFYERWQARQTRRLAAIRAGREQPDRVRQ